MDRGELCFLADEAGALIAYQETGASWTSLLAFSDEEKALEFRRRGGLVNCAVVAIDLADEASVRALITQVKRRAVRSLLLDLNFDSGHCQEVELIGQAFANPTERRLAPKARGSSLTHL